MEAEEYEKMFRLEDAHWWFAGKRALARALLKQILPRSARNLRILDVGCGTGGMWAALNPFGQVTGVDYATLALTFAQQRDVPRLAQASAPRLPFRAASFDLVTAFDVLYHRGVDDDTRALAEMARVCRPGGWLLVTDSAFRFLSSPHDVAYHAARRYTAAELRHKMNDAGWRVVRAGYANTFLFPLVLGWRLLQRARYAPGQGRSDLAALPSPLNRVLLTVYQLEAALIRYVDFPFGVSVVCVGEKAATRSRT